MKFLVINGPNLDMLGSREPSIYGSETLAEIEEYTIDKVSELAKNMNITIDWFQSNSEGDIVTRIGQFSSEDYDGLVINPAAYTHTSVAIADSLKMCSTTIVEVHLSNTHAREEMRKTKLTTSYASIVIEGAKKNVYSLAIMSLLMDKIN